MKKLNGSILIVEDDEHVILTSEMILKQYFEHIETLSSPKTLESLLRQRDFYVVLLDMNFHAGTTSGNEGLYWMNRIQKISPQTQVVLQTAYGDIELAVKSMKEGAVDFLPKPWEKDKLVAAIQNAYAISHARRESKTREKPSDIFIGESREMRHIMSSIEQVAATDANVLILGENGTGKELVAKAIHQHSKRNKEAFVSVDIGAIAHSLFDSEIFGHEKGAFTDAKETRVGKFEMANKGTLFLDEIGNLPLELQVKLLTVIQNRTFSKVGSNKTQEVDMRLICATNAPIYDLVKSGKFRQDLLYRIKTIELHIPPLKDRLSDMPLLLAHFVEIFSKRYNKFVEYDSDILKHLTAYHWPGNVRELQHAIERAVILSTGQQLTADDFKLNGTHSAPNSLQEEIKTLNLSQMEKEVIKQALLKCNGNLTRASEELGIGRSTLYRKMEEYGISLRSDG